MSGKETPGDTGTQYCVTYVGSFTLNWVTPAYAGVGPCSGGNFTLGTTSDNYIAGREGGFGDYQGYVNKNGTYYAKFVGNSEVQLPAEYVQELTNPYGVKYLAVTGANKLQGQGEEVMNWPIPGTPGEGFIGALFNLNNNPKYNGFNASTQIDNKETFLQILQTFQFIN